MSINVGRRGTAHDIALCRACELKFDVLLVQEPWWRGCTKSHLFFDQHIPFCGNDLRPRAVIYTRKNAREIAASQIFPSSFLTADYCWVVVNEITFLNKYKEPHNSEAVKPFLDWIPLA